MATFTTTTKTPISWDAPPPVDRTSESYQLAIGSGYLLEIGDTYNLNVQPASVGTVWATTNRVAGHQWPQTTHPNKYLDIGSGFDLLIGNGYKLAVDGAGRNETVWTKTNRNPVTY